MPNRTEPNVTKAAKSDAVQAAPDGLVGVFRTLANQHTEVAAMFDQLQASPDTRADLWPQIRRALVSHEHGEVRELYPVLRQLEATRALADQHDEEARALDALICRLDTIDIRSEGWLQLFAKLVDTVLHHAKTEEEARIFPIAQAALGEARAIELDAKVLLAKQQLAEMN